jgi:penicillin-binding protein 1A
MSPRPSNTETWTDVSSDMPSAPSRRPPAKSPPPPKFWGKALVLFILILLFVSLTAGGFYLVLLFQLPNIQSLDDYRPPLATRIYAADGTTLLGLLYKEKRILVSVSELPPHLIQAFIASEDARFFKHRGVDFLSILRALWKNLWAGEIVQGGSTITQQVTKSLLLTPEKRLTRKIKEAVLSYRLDRHLSKEEILYIYLNQIYLGQGAYGVEAAALTYFGKRARDLTLAESALLAGLPQAPSRYSPLTHFDKAKERQAYVLKRMTEEGYITENAAQEAYNTPLYLVRNGSERPNPAPHFVDMVRNHLYRLLGSDYVLTAGLTVETTLDVSFQKAAEEAVLNGTAAVQKRRPFSRAVKNVPPEQLAGFCRSLLRQGGPGSSSTTGGYTGAVVQVDPLSQTARVCLEVGQVTLPLPGPPAPLPSEKGREDAETQPATLPAPQRLAVGDIVQLRYHPWRKTWQLIDPNPVEAALLCLESQTGAVIALVGGRDHDQTEFNRAVQSRRQPGSAFKPIIYAAALEKGFTPASVLMDTPLYFKGPPPWAPQNFDQKFLGPVTLRTALIQSRNIISIRLLQHIGVPYVIDFARRLGITSPLYPNLSLALGSSGVSLWELVSAYNCFANLGEKVSPFFIRRIADRNNKILMSYEPRSEPVLDPQIAMTMIRLLEAVVKEGTGWKVKALGRPVAGKTGTTNDFRDAWFIGFTPRYTAGVWVGIDNLTPLGPGETGAQAASPIFLEFFQKALADSPVEVFPDLSGVEFSTEERLPTLPGRTSAGSRIP